MTFSAHLFVNVATCLCVWIWWVNQPVRKTFLTEYFVRHHYIKKSFKTVGVNLYVCFWHDSSFLFPMTPTSTSNGKVYVSEVKMRNAARKMYDAAKKQGKTAALVATKWVQNLFNTFSSGTGFGFSGNITVSGLPLETGTDHISFTFQQEYDLINKYMLKSTNSPNVIPHVSLLELQKTFFIVSDSAHTCSDIRDCNRFHL